MIEVEAVGTVGNARVGALVEVETIPACGALVATATNTGITRRGALFAALSVITEKATGALRHAHPGERGDLRERKWGTRGERERLTDNLYFLQTNSSLVQSA